MDAVNGAAADVLTAAALYRKSSLVGKVLGLCSFFSIGLWWKLLRIWRWKRVFGEGFC